MRRAQRFVRIALLLLFLGVGAAALEHAAAHAGAGSSCAICFFARLVPTGIHAAAPALVALAVYRLWPTLARHRGLHVTVPRRSRAPPY